MKLNKLVLHNFKGLRDFTLEPNGNNVSVFGENSTGKSTLADSVLWLLFGKDSSGAADFNIKTLDENGEPLHNLDHSVEAVFQIDNGTVTLKKTYKEKYNQKRGIIAKEFTGHETIYEIDGVPRSMGDFKKYIESIAHEQLFRLLTSPTFFSEQLKWQDRRKILLEVVGDISDSDVIASSEELSPLYAIIGNRSVDDAKKVENATRAKINEELKGIPERIDEATRAIDHNHVDKLLLKESELNEKNELLQSEINALREKKLLAMSGGLVQKKQQEIAEIDTSIAQMRTKHILSCAEYGKEDREALQLAMGKQSVLQGDIASKNSKKEQLEKRLETLKAANATIVEMWTAENAKQFVPDGICKTCGQDYPSHLIEQQKADFNRTKAVALERITKEGEANKADVIKIKSEIEVIISDIDSLTVAFNGVSATIDELKEKLSKITEPPSFETLPEYALLTEKKNQLTVEIGNLRAGSQQEVNEIEAQITAMQAEISAVMQQLAAWQNLETQEKRVEELKGREKDLVKQFETSERNLYLLDLFVKTKVSMLEGSINDKFDGVKWKLFSEQINGGLSETCVCTVNGVPYADINNGGKIKAGITVRNVLSAHYGMDVFCVIDNAESITDLPEVKGQLIKLVVSEGDKQLRIVYN